MSARFPGQVVLFTGACKGLSLTLAQAFLAEGAQVALAGSDGQGGSAAEALGARHFALDLGDGSAIRAVLRNVVDQYGRIDVWLHFMAGDRDLPPAATLDGVHRCARAIGPVMQGQGSGRVVFLASVAGLFAGAGQAQRNTLEAGLFMLARSLAVDWAPHGLRVNAIAHGIVQCGPEPPDVHLLGRIPMGRAARPQELVEAALFLADGQESAFVTGEVLRVDGGWTAYHLFHPFDTAFQTPPSD